MLANPAVTAPIIGPRTLEQMEESLWGSRNRTSCRCNEKN
ncbi:aryl-alcohol dehydrogenase-like predicted oxidoreductase [Neobacillus cucumis]|nr:aryl-alcohol dehydrogenase-like predicted oxidoreductase [Neobacillus cucumis]